MSRIRVTIEAEVDDQVFAAHDGDAAPPPNELEDWDASDLLAAQKLGMLDLGEAEITELEVRVRDDAKWQLVK